MTADEPGDGPAILLTNDDGIDSVGLRALYDGLSAVGEVTAVAPADDRSSVGRKLSPSVEVEPHDLGYAVEGTPADCVVAGLGALHADADIVVSGCNRGANLGEYVLGRSGTIGAAVEATFFGVPALAVSLYLPDTDEEPWHERGTDPDDYAEAVRAATYLADHAPDAGVFDRADYLNVNAPLPGDEPAPMAVTRPAALYDMRASRDGTRVSLDDHVWERLPDGAVEPPVETDGEAVVGGWVSVSPLTAPHTTERYEALDALAEAYLD